MLANEFPLLPLFYLVSLCLSDRWAPCITSSHINALKCHCIAPEGKLSIDIYRIMWNCLQVIFTWMKNGYLYNAVNQSLF